MRRPLRGHLPRDKKAYAPTADTCLICDGDMGPPGEDVAEQLEFEPTSFRVIRHASQAGMCLLRRHRPGAGVKPADCASYRRPKVAGAHPCGQVVDHLSLYRRPVIYAR